MQKNIKPISLSVFLSAILLAVNLSHAAPTAKVAGKERAPEVKLSDLKKQAAAVQDSKRLSASKVRKSKASGEEKKLAEKFRRLNKNVIKAQSGDSMKAQVFVGQYQEIENQIDQLSVVSGTTEGRGACMRECADNFPGTGGGNGVNRVACKIACLVLGE